MALHRHRILWRAIEFCGGRSIMAGDRILWRAIDNGGRSNSVAGDRILWRAIDNGGRSIMAGDRSRVAPQVHGSVAASEIDGERWYERRI
ncbi:hypothetical protein [Microcoleus sp. Pol12A5]|uniref:hypothetical protein n=1 Tax=Microcoleus sp. Pol12A5 TaxID=3055392 RepID=UPI002FCFBF73